MTIDTSEKNRNAVVYCQGAFNTLNGKTAHGLVRFTDRFNVIAVIDSNYANQDAGFILDKKYRNIPIVKNIEETIKVADHKGIKINFFIMGIAPDGGRFDQNYRNDFLLALQYGFNIVSGLHDFLSDDPEFYVLAHQKGCKIIDVRKVPPRSELNFFTGKIEEVKCLKIAILGTDSAVGKRTTAWQLVHGLIRKGYKAELIGTGQTAWMQGAKYSIIMDSLINDFVAGEIENAMYQAWIKENPDVLIIEGQGSLMNPAYPGGFEILAAGRPDIIIMQHAPRRLDYDGFPGYPIHDINKQIQVVELLSNKKVVALALNHENMVLEEIENECDKLSKITSLPTFDVLTQGTEGLIELLKDHMKCIKMNQKILSH